MQKYLTVVSAVLSDAKRNEIISKNPARMIDLPDTERREQFIPTDEQAQYFLNALSEEHILYHAFYVLAIYTGCRRGELCALRWERLLLCGSLHLEPGGIPLPQCSAGKGVVEGPTKNGRSRSMTISYYVVSALWSLYNFQKRMARENHRRSAPTCSPTPRGSRFTRTPSPSVCGRFSGNWASPLLFICIPCATTLSPPCSTREWTSRLSRSWQATGHLFLGEDILPSPDEVEAKRRRKAGGSPVPVLKTRYIAGACGQDMLPLLSKG